jgi:hypothetical protein
MSNAVQKAIQRAKEKRERKLAIWWQNRMKDPVESAKIERNKKQFEADFAAGIPMEFPVVVDEII